MLKIDGIRDIHGIEVAKRMTQGRHYGVPFHVIYDHNESMLMDSSGNLGNIGFPSGFEGKKHLRKMLESSCKRLTAAEIDQLVASLKD